MNDLEKLFLAAYPLWPKQLLQKFASLLSYEVAKFNPQINPQIIEEYKKLSNGARLPIEPYKDNVSYLLQPENASKVSQVYYGKEILRQNWARPADGGLNIMGPDLSEYKWYTGKVYYDARIYKAVSIQIDLNYQDVGGTYDVSYLAIMSYSSMRVQPVLASAYAVASVILGEYDGASTVLAMVENGIKVDVDKNLLREFVTFLNAHSKYGGQLAAAKSLQAEKNRQSIADYENAVSEKLTARKNELSDMKTQIAFAAKNETASAKRDMQNLALNAQSLMLQLQSVLK